MKDKTVLVITDMQRYYLESDSDYCRFFDSLQPGCMQYISERCRRTVIPNITKVLKYYTDNRLNVIFLKIAGKMEDRSDLHYSFREAWERARSQGIVNIYPLIGDPMSDLIPELNIFTPYDKADTIVKQAYSGFTNPKLQQLLTKLSPSCLAFTGLATSQCVETTARDASDRGYRIIHIEDAQADYSHESHIASLYSSRGVCGGNILTTEEFIQSMESDDFT